MFSLWASCACVVLVAAGCDTFRDPNEVVRTDSNQDQSGDGQDLAVDQELDAPDLLVDIPDDQSSTNSPCEALDLIEQVTVGDRNWTLDGARCFERRDLPQLIDAEMTSVAVDINGNGFVRALRDVQKRQGIVQAWSGSTLENLQASPSIPIGDSGEGAARNPKYVDGIMVARTSAGSLVVAASGLDPNCAEPRTAGGAVAWIDTVNNAAGLNGQLNLDQDTAVAVATADECGEIPGELGFLVDEQVEPKSELLVYREYPPSSLPDDPSMNTLDISLAQDSYQTLSIGVSRDTSVRISRTRSNTAIVSTGNGVVLAFQRSNGTFSGPDQLTTDSIAAFTDRKQGSHPDVIALVANGGLLTIQELSCTAPPGFLDCNMSEAQELEFPGITVMSMAQLGEESVALVFAAPGSQQGETEVWLTVTDVPVSTPAQFVLMPGSMSGSLRLFTVQGQVTALDMDSKVEAMRTTFAISAITTDAGGIAEELMFFRMARQDQ